MANTPSCASSKKYVGMHGQRMAKKEAERGDFWLWCAIDPDTKLVVSFLIGRRDRQTGTDFMNDVARCVTGPVQIAILAGVGSDSRYGN